MKRPFFFCSYLSDLDSEQENNVVRTESSFNYTQDSIQKFLYALRCQDSGT